MEKQRTCCKKMSMGVCEAQGTTFASCDQTWARTSDEAEGIGEWGAWEVRMTVVDLWVSQGG